ncbi:RNA polymerase Rpc34 subunit-domain-containing protein [Gloeopeniophorella convolvens]|nr:RNA polymerase Rpc34 subunit-domain-containing protein [Gloeopeniophorella convolvens]
MASSSSRKLNTLESRIHQSALQTGRPLSQKEIDALAPDPHARTGALNFLLAAGLLKLMKDTGGSLSYRAVQKNELDAKKGLSGEESMVLGHIQTAANQGIWTKHLKAKTELHQTVIDRCLKSLVQKQLIKSVKGVKYPTRKIYMMAHLEPSVELTGGPWYTDNELDSEFIKLLCSACLRYIRERTVPKHKHDDGRSSSSQPLYPISAGIAYPDAKEVLNFLSKSRITETQFTEEHVEMLLNVLVLDGDVERLPAFGITMWAADDDDASDGSSTASSTGAKRDRKKRKKGRKKQAQSDGDSPVSEEEQRPRKKSSKKGKASKDKRKRKRESDGEDIADDTDEESNVKKRKKQKIDQSDNEKKQDSKRSSKPKGASRSKSKSSKKSRVSESDSETNSGSSTDSDSYSDAGSKLSRSQSSKSSKHGKSSRSEKKTRARSSLPTAALDGSAYVYKAVRQERVALGWSEAPCGRCPVFGFCKDGGPVGPGECEYYGEWLKKEVVSVDS